MQGFTLQDMTLPDYDAALPAPGQRRQVELPRPRGIWQSTAAAEAREREWKSGNGKRIPKFGGSCVVCFGGLLSSSNPPLIRRWSVFNPLGDGGCSQFFEPVSSLDDGGWLHLLNPPPH